MPPCRPSTTRPERDPATHENHTTASMQDGSHPCRHPHTNHPHTYRRQGSSVSICHSQGYGRCPPGHLRNACDHRHGREPAVYHRHRKVLCRSQQTGDHHPPAWDAGARHRELPARNPPVLRNDRHRDHSHPQGCGAARGHPRRPTHASAPHPRQRHWSLCAQNHQPAPRNRASAPRPRASGHDVLHLHAARTSHAPRLFVDDHHSSAPNQHEPAPCREGAPRPEPSS